jgi:hypothetical protein
MESPVCVRLPGHRPQVFTLCPLQSAISLIEGFERTGDVRQLTATVRPRKGDLLVGDVDSSLLDDLKTNIFVAATAK